VAQHNSMAVADDRPIGMLDSGVGGLSILRQLQRQLPGEDVVYVADQGHVPYGPRSKAQIRSFVRGIVRFLLLQRVKVAVVACNAASAAALHHLRDVFTEIPFVGMEPAVKPAAEQTRAGTIGVLTTAATFQGELFASVVDQFAREVRVVTQVCPEFVDLVESGEIDTPAARGAVQARLAPLLAAGIDQLVLGCTHFPFLTPLLREVAGPDVTIVDPSEAVARQTGRMIGARGAGSAGRVTCFTSGPPAQLRPLLARLLDQDAAPEVAAVHWTERAGEDPVLDAS
jgi:glutamate racemase